MSDHRFAHSENASPVDLTTRAGTVLHVRTAVPGDVANLANFFESVDREDLRHRFFCTMKKVEEDQLAVLASDGDPGTVSFLAFNNDKMLIACATLCDDSGGETADVALSVHREWKGQGVSWTLLEHVLHYAKEHGLKTVTSLESGDDRTAINLEREMGFVARLSSASPVEVTLSKIVGGD